MTWAVGGVLDPHGPVAGTIVDLWWWLLALGVLAFAVFAVLLAVGLWRRPADPGSEETGRRTIRRWLGWGGVVFPTVLIVVTFAVTLVAMRATPSAVPEDALEVEIVGHQFFYEISYPEHGITTTDQLRLPVGRPVALRLRSADVIHSFWVPELGGKLDMLPERVNTLVLTADEPGAFRSRCAEFCGLLHAHMILDVLVEPADDFAAWVERERTIAGGTAAP